MQIESRPPDVARNSVCLTLIDLARPLQLVMAIRQRPDRAQLSQGDIQRRLKAGFQIHE